VESYFMQMGYLLPKFHNTYHMGERARLATGPAGASCAGPALWFAARVPAMQKGLQAAGQPLTDSPAASSTPGMDRSGPWSRVPRGLRAAAGL
jgi:hypothetical protein